MAATVEISETNGTAPGTVTDGVSNINFGSADSPNLVAANNAIVAGQNSYEKWERFHVTAMGGSTKIDNLRVYWPGGAFPIGTGTYVKTNTKTSGYSSATYATPVTTASTVATVNLATAEPGSANLGIAGSLTGSFSAAGYSDYGVFQVQTNAADTAGSSITIRFRYDEIA